MTTYQKSLLSYLTQKNPVLNADRGCKGRNTTSNKQTWKEPAKIDEWKDFQLESLASIYDGQLKKTLGTNIRCPDLFDIPPFPFCEIHDEDSLEGLLTLWNQQIVSNALAVAQDKLDAICTSGRIYMARGGQAQPLKSYPKEDKKRNSYPDWAAVKRLENMQEAGPKASNILPGDTKISSKWKSNSVKRGDRNAYNSTPDSARPVIQVFNYCLRANARYGYIITDQELVVLRVRANEKTNEQGNSQNMEESQESQEAYASEAQKKARKSGGVELMSIPWDNYVDDTGAVDFKLTVNLALWWLHIMAAADSRLDSEYPKLSEEKLPKAKGSNNFSFSAEIANMNLDPSASFTGQHGGPAQTGKKRKLDHTLQSKMKSTRRK